MKKLVAKCMAIIMALVLLMATAAMAEPAEGKVDLSG